MLRRQRQIRVRIHKLTDAGLFSLAFWMAHQLRAVWKFGFFWERPEIEPFREYAWMIAIIVPIAPVLWAMQGFYDRPLLAARRQTVWQLFWACAWTTIIVILISFLARQQPARGVIVLFGAISFLVVLFKEEIIRRWVESRFGQDHLKRRLLIVGTVEDTEPLHAKLNAQSREGIEILAEVNLNDTPVERLVELLHDHSANGVILSAKHTMFGQVERVIQACELEGVEVWLLADFFKTQISQTAFDDFEGRREAQARTGSAQRDDRPGVQVEQRSARHAHRPVYPQIQHRRISSVGECGPRRNEPGGPAASAGR